MFAFWPSTPVNHSTRNVDESVDYIIVTIITIIIWEAKFTYRTVHKSV
jgi:hypothetical protein